jgi:hypothetical protein
MPLYNEKTDEAGSTDFMVIFRDNTALVYDHKFINFKYKQVTFEDYKSRPENKGKSDAVLLDEIYAMREKQGLTTSRYAPTKTKSGNQFFYEIDDSNIDGLYRWKQDSYEMQLSTYADMLRDIYGVKKMRQVRVIPNVVSYTKFANPDGSISVDPKRSKLQFLMTGSGSHGLLKQLPSKAELTNDKHVNQFIDKLEKEKEKLRTQLNTKGWDSNYFTVQRFNEISDAIVSLKVDNGLMNVVDIVSTLLKDINSRINQEPFLVSEDGEEYPNPRYMSLRDINNYTEELDLYSTFVASTMTYIKTLEKKDATEFNAFKSALGLISEGMTLTRQELIQQAENRLLKIAEDEQLMTGARFMSYEQQADINQIERYFTHLGNVRHPLVNMFKQLYDKINYNRFEYEKNLIKDIETR